MIDINNFRLDEETDAYLAAAAAEKDKKSSVKNADRPER